MLPVQCCVNFVKQRIAKKRLLDESDAGRRGAFPDRGAGMCRNENRRSRNLTTPQLCHQVQSVHSRQLVVDNKATGLGGQIIPNNSVPLA